MEMISTDSTLGIVSFTLRAGLSFWCPILSTIWRRRSSGRVSTAILKVVNLTVGYNATGATGVLEP